MAAEKETYLFYRLIKERTELMELNSDHLATACPSKRDYHQAQKSAFREVRIALLQMFDALNKFGTKEEWLNA